MKSARGFTLVEMLVALLAFSLLASAAVAILNFSLRSKQAFDESATVLGQIQIARVVMKADFAQLAPRAVRDPYGGPPRGSFVEGSTTDAQILLSFVRRGWDNPGGAESRSSLQYVEYALNGKALVRRVRPYMDATPDMPIITTTLIDGVSATVVAFRSGDKWLEQWRPVARSEELPDAVAVTMNVSGLGEIRQAFLTSAR